MDNKTLTVILCQTREGNYTFNSLQDKVLRPLASDLAFCGSTDPGEEDKIIANAKYVWNFPEPSNWADACDAVSTNNSNWRDLCKFGKVFLGGGGFQDSIGSGLIIMYWREILRQSLTKEILSKYDWFIITRSDFNWVVEHPDVKLLDPKFLYFLDGEKYGGVSDRHIIFHTSLATKVLSIANGIFHESKELEVVLLESPIKDLNPEKYIYITLGRMGMQQQIKFIPYLGYAIRHENTKTRWSSGSYSPRHGYYIKYPKEFIASLKNKFVIRSQADWRDILSNDRNLWISLRTLISKSFHVKHQLDRVKRKLLRY